MYIVAHTDGYSITMDKYDTLEDAQNAMRTEYEDMKASCPCEDPLEDSLTDDSAVWADYNNYYVWKIEKFNI